MEDQHRQPLSLGTGFVVRNELVATNFHVIRGASTGYAKLLGATATFPIKEIVAKDPQRDLVILRVPGLQARPLSLVTTSQPSVGDAVFAIGTPKGLEGTLSQGIVSAIRNVGRASLYQITAPISPGSSGGPVVDASGAVIGIAVATLRGGQNLNFAISTAHLIELLGRGASAEPLPSSSKAKAKDENPILSQIGGAGIEKVTTSNMSCVNAFYTWHCNFSVRNGLEIGIKDVRYLAILWDQKGRPLDSREGWVAKYGGPVRPGLARRTSDIDGQFDIDHDVKKMLGRIEVRILYFSVQD